MYPSRQARTPNVICKMFNLDHYRATQQGLEEVVRVLPGARTHNQARFKRCLQPENRSTKRAPNSNCIDRRSSDSSSDKFSKLVVTTGFKSSYLVFFRRKH